MPIIFNVEALLHFLGVHQISTIIWIAGAVLLVQIWLLSLLIYLMVSRRVVRLWTRRNNYARSKKMYAQLSEYLKKPPAGTSYDCFKISSSDRYFFRRILMSEIRASVGSEKRLFQRVYKDLGYFYEDSAEIHSRFWWVRLAALVRLQEVLLPESITLVEPLVHDSRDDIALMAIRTLSFLSKPDRISDLLDQLSRRAPDRRDVFMEILSHLGEESIPALLKYLENCYDPFIAALCIRVLGDFKRAEVLPALVQLSKSSDDFVVLEVARALGKLSSAEAELRLIELTQHSDQRVRAEALRSLHRLQLASTALIKKLAIDESIDVKRAVFDVKRETKR